MSPLDLRIINAQPYNVRIYRTTNSKHMLIYKTDVSAMQSIHTEKIRQILDGNECVLSSQQVTDSCYGVIYQYNQQLCAIAAVNVRENEHHIQGVCTKYSHRHTGMGAQLLDFLLGEIGPANVIVDVPSDSTAHSLLVEFYKFHGFQVDAASDIHTKLVLRA